MVATSEACLLRGLVGITHGTCWQSPVPKSCSQTCLSSGLYQRPTARFQRQASTSVLCTRHSPELVGAKYSPLSLILSLSCALFYALTLSVYSFIVNSVKINCLAALHTKRYRTCCSFKCQVCCTWFAHNVPWPGEHAYWRQFGVQWRDCTKTRLGPFCIIIIY